MTSGAFGSLFRRSKKEDTNEESRDAGGVQIVSEEAKKKAQAAKEYIEKVRHPSVYFEAIMKPSLSPFRCIRISIKMSLREVTGEQ